ncbi:MAG TPA: hypothetical protein VK971_00145 [Thiohalobacter sp.]|nr:hypothetical protein [Thiohalobacter sp.]
MSIRTAAVQSDVMTVAELGIAALAGLLQRYRLTPVPVAAGDEIPGSFWGESEAGLIDNRLYLRPDTPVHSGLHEACHYVCMDSDRRRGLHTDAGGDYAEEDAVCYLQVLLADRLPGVGRARLLADMDAWGYSFRLGSARRWFEQDAGDALAWLQREGVVDAHGEPTWRLRDAAA